MIFLIALLSFLTIGGIVIGVHKLIIYLFDDETDISNSN